MRIETEKRNAIKQQIKEDFATDYEKVKQLQEDSKSLEASMAYEKLGRILNEWRRAR